jgi:hypothetical protein
VGQLLRIELRQQALALDPDNPEGLHNNSVALPMEFCETGTSHPKEFTRPEDICYRCRAKSVGVDLKGRLGRRTFLIDCEPGG